jgi:hypothetical protein
VNGCHFLAVVGALIGGQALATFIFSMWDVFTEDLIVPSVPRRTR